MAAKASLLFWAPGGFPTSGHRCRKNHRHSQSRSQEYHQTPCTVDMLRNAGSTITIVQLFWWMLVSGSHSWKTLQPCKSEFVKGVTVGVSDCGWTRTQRTKPLCGYAWLAAETWTLNPCEAATKASNFATSSGWRTSSASEIGFLSQALGAVAAYRNRGNMSLFLGGVCRPSGNLWPRDLLK